MNDECVLEDLLDEIFDLATEIKHRLRKKSSEGFVFNAICDIQQRSTVIKRRCLCNDSNVCNVRVAVVDKS